MHQNKIDEINEEIQLLECEEMYCTSTQLSSLSLS